MFPKRAKAEKPAGSAPATLDSSAQRHRDRMAQRSRDAFAGVSDIGEIPSVKDQKRRDMCRLNLHRFLVTYYPRSTGLRPFSDEHKKAIRYIQRCILEGGRFALAFPRGFAKTTIIENAIQWAALYGHRKYLAIFGADANIASGNIESIKVEISENDLLYEDFPEVCHAVRALEGKVQRCHSQTYKGELTHIEWTADQIVFPTIPGSAGSGAIIVARGLTGGSRGMKHKRPDGTQQRPDMVFLDDPQTDESANSPLQVKKRLDIVKKSILKLGGHAGKIACLMAATVIQPDDMVDQLLDPKKNPAWQGVRIPMIKRWAATHETMWLGEYAKIRNTYNADDVEDQARAHKAATAYYTAFRNMMDAAAEVTWDECYDRESEASALQHAYNILIDDGPEAFASECQNAPLREEKVAANKLTSAMVLAKANGILRGIVPIGATKLTAFIDVHDEVLYYTVCAWGDRFTGHVVDYGTWPDQQRPYFAHREAKRKISDEFPGMEYEARMLAALDALAEQLLGREWEREDKSTAKIERLMADANDGDATIVVREFCRRSRHAAVLMPSHGKGYTSKMSPIDEAKSTAGEVVGHNWRTRPGKNLRYAMWDVNKWKTFVSDRLAMAKGTVGGITLFGREADHEMFADHATAEDSHVVEGRGRKVTEWDLKVGHDNHLLDCLVGSACGASIIGITTVGMAPGPKARKRLKLSDIQRGKR